MTQMLSSFFSNQLVFFMKQLQLIHKVLIMVLFAAMGSGSGVQAQTTVQMGSGTGNAAYFPLYYMYSYNYTQTIYTADEINGGGWSGGPGIISKIRWRSHIYKETANWNDWIVYLGNTNKAGFNNTTDWVPVGTMAQVFNSKLPVSAVLADGWLELSLATPFVWNGADNLVVAVFENTPGGGYTSGNWYGYTVAPSSGNKGIYYSSVGTEPNPGSPPSGILTDEVAQIQLDIASMPVCSGTLDATIISSTPAVKTGESFVLTASPNDATGITYQFQKNEGSGWQNLGSPQASPTYTVPTQSIATDYRVAVSCGVSTGTSAPIIVAQYNNVTIAPSSTIISNIPIDPGSHYSYSQVIYTSAELTAGGAPADGGAITKIRWKPTHNASTDNWKNWVVYLGNTSKTAFSNTSDWLPLNSLTQVFDGLLPVDMTTAGEWMEINLTTPFLWAGDNLVVAVDENSNGGGSYTQWDGFTAGSYRGINYATNGLNIDPASPPVADRITNKLPNIQFAFVPSAPCSGTPVASLTATPGNICAGTPVTLSAYAPVGITGLTYQFQNNNGSGWENIATPDSNTFLTIPTQTSTTQYRVRVSCSGNTGTSTPVSVDYSLCYCIPVYINGCSSIHVIEDFILYGEEGTAINHVNSSCSDDAYGRFTDMSVDLGVGGTYTGSMTTLGDLYESFRIWIDFNDNGTFEAVESLTMGGPFGSADAAIFELQIPDDAPLGIHRMRVRLSFAEESEDISPCATGFQGEAHDYSVNIVIPPVPSITSFSPASGCSATEVTISGNNLLGVTGVSFGGVLASSFTIVDATTIKAYVPSGSPGGQIVVTNGGGSATSVGSFVIFYPPMPTAISATPNEVYYGEVFDLSAISTGNNILWYTTAAGGSPIGAAASGDNLVRTENIPGIYTYFAEALAPSGCVSTSRGEVDVVVKGPAITSTSPASHCGPGIVTLAATASPTNAMIRWFDLPTGGTLLGTGNMFTTPALESTTTYYAEAIQAGGGNVTFGSGNKTSGDDRISPFELKYGSYKHQYLIRASELQAKGMLAGPIISLAFDVVSPFYGTTYETLNNFSVSIKQTSAAALTPTFETDLTEVWSGNYTPNTGINTFTFSEPLIWDGVSSIVIQTCFNNNNSGNILRGAKVRYNEYAYYVHSVDYKNTPNDACTVTSILGPDKFRPKIILGTPLPEVSPWVPVVATINPTDGFWNGSVSTDWNDAANWCGGIPTEATDVLIDGSAANQPTILPAEYGSAGNITLDSGSLTISGTLNIKGNLSFVNGGAVDASAGNFNLGGDNNQTLPNEPLSFNTLNISGGGNKTFTDSVFVSNTLVFDNGRLVLDNATLTLGYAATLINNNDTGSYVVTVGNNSGLRQWITSSGSAFPVGHSSFQMATLVNNAATEQYFTVRVNDGVWTGGVDGTLVDPNHTYVVDRTWYISPDEAAGADVNMMLLWSPGQENSAAFDYEHVYIAHHNGTQWENLSTLPAEEAPAAGEMGNGMYVASQSNVTSFSPFTVGSGLAPFPLPVVLTSISARNEGSSNRIEWHSGKEANVSHYEIEKSSDGKSFNYLSKTEAMNQPFGYITYDAAPFEGFTYYQLKMVDKDGSFAYSKVVSAFMKRKSDFVISVVPNPAAAIVTVNVEGGTKEARLQLMDLSGSVLMQQEMMDGKARFDISLLAQGIYFVKYIDGNRVETIKVEKQ